MTTLLKNGMIVTAVDQYRSDVLIDGEKIVAIGTGLEGRAEKVIDVRGRYLFPGGIDVHAHFSLPFMGTQGAGYETTRAGL